ncbi:MAG: L,D-transpeptidase, partial [Mycobacteriales bacterium]
GFSDVYATFDGGLPLIGIHGTDEPWVIGTSYSHGCVRLHDPDAAILASLVPLGTPIRILP